MMKFQQNLVPLVVLMFFAAFVSTEEKVSLTVSQTPYADCFHRLRAENLSLADLTLVMNKCYTQNGTRCENDRISPSALHHGTWLQAVTTLYLVAILLTSKRERIFTELPVLYNMVKLSKTDDYNCKKLDYHYIFNFYEIPKQVNTVAMLSVEKMTANREMGDNTPNVNSTSNNNYNLSRYGSRSNTNNPCGQGATGGTQNGFKVTSEKLSLNQRGASADKANGHVEHNTGKVSENHGLGNKTRNYYSVIDGTSKETSYSSRPRHPDFADKRARDQSFRNWPRSGKPDPDVISAAGFYSIDYEDSVRCFHCGGGLFNLTSSMDPFEEHLKYFPTCDFIRNYRRTPAHQVPCSKDERRQHQNEAEKGMSAPSNSDEKQQLTYNDIKSLLAMGLKKSQVEELILRQFSSGCPETTNTDSVLQTQASNEPTNMTAAIDNRNPSQSSEKSSSQLSATNLYQEQACEMSNGHSKRQKEVAKCPFQKDEDALHSLKEENHKLRETMLCKICLDRNSSIVFMNCGHMVSCPECAPSLRKCPVCRKRIRERIKIV